MRPWLLAAAVVLTALPLFAQDETDRKPLALFSAVDVYLAGDVDDNDQARLVRSGEALAAAGNNSEGGVETDAAGYGFRVGLRCAKSRHFDAGLSLGYVRAPDIEAALADITAPEGASIRRTETSYLRALIEAGVNVTIYKRLALRLGGGVGVARGESDLSAGGTGSLAGSAATASETHTGLTWEISPAFLITLPRGALEIGARYTKFPTIGATSASERLEWDPISVYLGFSI